MENGGVWGHEPYEEISGHGEDCGFHFGDTDKWRLVFKGAEILPGVSLKAWLNLKLSHNVVCNDNLKELVIWLEGHVSPFKTKSEDIILSEEKMTELLGSTFK